MPEDGRSDLLSCGQHKKRGDAVPSSKLFGRKEAFALAAKFCSALVCLNLVVRLLGRLTYVDTRPYWPLGEFHPRIPDPPDLLVAALVGIAFCLLACNNLRWATHGSGRLMIIGVLLVLSTNLIQGFHAGFANPISGEAGGSIQYYHDAIKVENPIEFLGNFERLQPNLLDHSRTSPPGAVLTIYLLLYVVKEPWAISVVIGVASVCLSVFFLRRILHREFGDKISGYATLLFVLLPSVQVYYLASLDVLIATSLLGCLTSSATPSNS